MWWAEYFKWFAEIKRSEKRYSLPHSCSNIADVDKWRRDRTKKNRDKDRVKLLWMSQQSNTDRVDVQEICVAKYRWLPVGLGLRESLWIHQKLVESINTEKHGELHYTPLCSLSIEKFGVSEIGSVFLWRSLLCSPSGYLIEYKIH